MQETSAMKRISISLPAELVSFADQVAKRRRVSRSKAISIALDMAREQELQSLAAEGYQFYAEEASRFAEESAAAVAESWQSVAPAKEWEDVR